MKKLVSLVLVLMLFLSCFTGTVRAWDEEHMIHVITSGKDSDNINWFLTTDYVLRVEGSGAIKDGGCGDNFSWYRYNSLNESIVLADGITAIGNFAFEYNTMRRVYIPASVTRIGTAAFRGDENLIDVYYGGSEQQWNAISIGSSNNSLNSATMHFGADNTYIGNCGTYSSGYEWKDYPRWVMEGTTLTIKAQNSAYPNISGTDSGYLIIRTEQNQWIDLRPQAKTLVLDGGVNSTVSSLLYNFTGLKTIQVNSSNPNLKAVSNVLFTKDGKTLLLFPAGSGKTSYTVPDGTNKINGYSFGDCGTLRSVTIPVSVTEIGSGAFRNTGVTDVYYYGTQSQWNEISIMSGNQQLTGATLHFVNKPSITTQPSGASVISGNTATFKVTASGTGLKYRWQWRPSSSSTWRDSTSATTGYNTSVLKVSGAVSRDKYQYRCRITDTAGNTVYSNTVTLRVLGITTQPKSVSAKSGGTASFSVAASGNIKSYRWQWRPSSSSSWRDSTSATTGYNTSNLKVSAATSRDGYQYRCRITDTAGNTVYSNTVTLRVLGITAQPKSVSVKSGSTASFSVAASGNIKSYQWQWRENSSSSWKDSSSSVTGYNTATLKITAAMYRNGYQYRCRIKDSAGNTVYSNAATLSVWGITSHPSSVSTTAGKTATFKVTAAGSGLSYQWQWRENSSAAWKNSSSSTTGYNTATLKVTAAAYRNGYQYRCKVTNSSGSTVYSDAAKLTVK